MILLGWIAGWIIDGQQCWEVQWGADFSTPVQPMWFSLFNSGSRGLTYSKSIFYCKYVCRNILTTECPQYSTSAHVVWDREESFTVHLAPPQIDTGALWTNGEEVTSWVCQPWGLEYEEQYEMLVKYKTCLAAICCYWTWKSVGKVLLPVEWILGTWPDMARDQVLYE